MSEKRTTVYITKYALTKGIYKDKVVIPEDRSSSHHLLLFPKMAVGSCYNYFYGNDWHHAQHAAVARAKEMRTNKIKSLKRQLKRIQNLKFEVEPDCDL